MTADGPICNRRFWQRLPAYVVHFSAAAYNIDMLKQFWAQSWPEVETITGVANNDLTHPEAYRPGHDYLASVTDGIVNRFLPGWYWWVSHNGASDSGGIAKKLNVQPRGHVDKTASVTIDENDIGPRFRLRPSVDPRNYITVCGDDDPDTASERPVSRISVDTASQAAYGVRHLVTKEGSVFDGGALVNACNSLLEQRRWDLLQGRFRLPDWSIEPGDKVSITLPTIGIDNAPWILLEVEEQVNQGQAERYGTFVEHSDAAFARVT